MVQCAELGGYVIRDEVILYTSDIVIVFFISKEFAEGWSDQLGDWERCLVHTTAGNIFVYPPDESDCLVPCSPLSTLQDTVTFKVSHVVEVAPVGHILVAAQTGNVMDVGPVEDLA